MMVAVPSMEFEADRGLTQRAADGDARARRLLANRLVRRVARVSRAMLNDPIDAEDASQVALIEILKSVHNYAGEGSLERWADRITARTVIRYIRGQRKARDRVQAREDVAETAETRGEISIDVQLSGYLAPLSPERREVLVLRHVLEYSVREIATIVDAPEGTVKDRLVAARKQVRRLVQQELSAASAGSQVS
jgi:RNA polymerase sigma-70 factor (ECF subfamily)